MKLMTRISTALLAFVACIVHPITARAAEPGDIEPAVLPLIGGDTDFGLGIGFLGAVSKLDDPITAYRWKLQFTAITTFQYKDSKFKSPYQDYLLKFTKLNFLGDNGRIDVLGNFTHSMLYYPGLGNASVTAPDPSFDRYERSSIVLQAVARLPLGRSKVLFNESSMGFTHNEASYAPNSRIALDRLSADPVIRGGANLPTSSGVPLFTQALVFDSRDSEVATETGMWHRVAIRAAPGAGGTSYFATPYAGVDAYLRGYHRIVHERLIFAWRVIADALVGDPATYELGRHETGWALGGNDGLRGVPSQRYYGAVKGMATAEMRFWIFGFRLAGTRMRLGGAVFGDAGRVFATTKGRTDLDGTGAGIKYGLGGGPRLSQGRQFEARVDVAYSPDAKPVGIYVGAGQAF